MREMASDHRREERTAVQARFSARDASGAGTLTFLSHDVSTGGVFLKSDLLLEQGETLRLTFDVPGAPREGKPDSHHEAHRGRQVHRPCPAIFARSRGMATRLARVFIFLAT